MVWHGETLYTAASVEVLLVPHPLYINSNLLSLSLDGNYVRDNWCATVGVGWGFLGSLEVLWTMYEHIALYCDSYVQMTKWYAFHIYPYLFSYSYSVMLFFQAEGIGYNPLYLMFPVALSTSFAFMLPVATPPNAIAFSYGRLRILDMVTFYPMYSLIQYEWSVISDQ